MLLCFTKKLCVRLQNFCVLCKWKQNFRIATLYYIWLHNMQFWLYITGSHIWTHASPSRQQCFPALLSRCRCCSRVWAAFWSSRSLQTPEPHAGSPVTPYRPPRPPQGSQGGQRSAPEAAGPAGHKLMQITPDSHAHICWNDNLLEWQPHSFPLYWMVILTTFSLLQCNIFKSAWKLYVE